MGMHFVETGRVGVIAGMQAVLFNFSSLGGDVRISARLDMPFSGFMLARVACGHHCSSMKLGYTDAETASPNLPPHLASDMYETRCSSSSRRGKRAQAKGP